MLGAASLQAATIGCGKSVHQITCQGTIIAQQRRCVSSGGAQGAIPCPPGEVAMRPR